MSTPQRSDTSHRQLRVALRSVAPLEKSEARLKRQVRKLEAAGCHYITEGAVATALRHCTSLTTLRARCLDAPVATVSRLISLLGVCHRLSVLDIGENALPDHMVPPSNWIPSLAKVLPYSQVATVDISSCRVTDECVGALATAIAESNLTSLDMSDNGIGSVGAGGDATIAAGGTTAADAAGGNVRLSGGDGAAAVKHLILTLIFNYLILTAALRGFSSVLQDYSHRAGRSGAVDATDPLEPRLHRQKKILLRV